MANSVEPDEVAHNEPSHLDVHCLQIQLFIACQNEGSGRTMVVILASASASTSASRLDVLVKVFKLTGKALSGELSLYANRSDIVSISGTSVLHSIIVLVCRCIILQI